jgi:hypothetical protein
MKVLLYSTYVPKILMAKKSKWRLYGSNFMKLNYMADRSNIRELIIKMEACTAATERTH